MVGWSIYRAFLSASVVLCLVVGSLCGSSAAEFTVAELHARHTDALLRLDLVRLRTRFERVLLGSGTESLQGAADARLNAMRNDPGLQQLFRDEMAKNGIELGPGMAGIEGFVRGRLVEEKRVATQQAKVESEHEFIRGPIRQIRMFLNPEHLTKIESGRNSRVLQYGLQHTEVPDASNRWTCLDEREIDGKQVYWCKTTILLDGMIPPGFEHHSLDGRNPTDLRDLWESPEDIATYGEFDFDGVPVQVVGTTLGAEAMILAAYSNKRQSGFPSWITRCQRLGESGKMDGVQLKAVDLTRESIADYVERLVALSSGSNFDCEVGSVYPRFATFLQEEKEIPEVGFYPTKLRQLIVGRGKASENSYKLYVSSAFEMTASDIERVTPDAVVPLVIKKGVSYLDKDTNISVVVGQKHDLQIANLASGWRGRQFIIANAALVGIICALVYIRLRRKSSES